MPWPRPWWNSSTTDAFTAHTLYLIRYTLPSMAFEPFLHLFSAQRMQWFFLLPSAHTHTTSVATSMKQCEERHRPFEWEIFDLGWAPLSGPTVLFSVLSSSRTAHCWHNRNSNPSFTLCWQNEIRCGNALRVRWILNFRLHVRYVSIVFITRSREAFTTWYLTEHNSWKVGDNCELWLKNIDGRFVCAKAISSILMIE